MRGGLVCRFYRDTRTDYTGVPPSRVLELTLAYKKNMLEWLNEHSNSTFKDLKDFHIQKTFVLVKKSTYVPEPKFQCDNTFTSCVEVQSPFLDEESSGEN